MKSILRSTAILGSSSIVTVVVGLASAKAWAVLVGPSGVGYYGLLLSLLSLSSLLAGMGIGTGLVRMGAKAVAHDDRWEMAALQRAAWLLYWVLGGVALLVLIGFRQRVSAWALGSPEHDRDVMVVGAAMLFMTAAGIQSSTINAHHRVGALARLAMLNSVCGTAVSLLLIGFLRQQGIVPAVLGVALVNWTLASVIAHQEIAAAPAPFDWQQIYRQAVNLIRFGAPFTASTLVGTGVQLALPIIVLHQLGQDSVGFYRAAVAISVNYLGFLVTAMAQDYYPRVAAVSDQPETLRGLINQQHHLILLLSVPMILGVLAVTPLLIPLVYSSQFIPAVDILEWQLIGDLFKFSSWTMSYVILARCSSMTYFTTELVGGAALLGANLLATKWFGLVGLGIGFLVAQIVYFGVVFVILRREIRWTGHRQNVLIMLGGLLAMLVVRTFGMAGLLPYRMPVALALVLVTGCYTLWRLRHELQGVLGAIRAA